jgi:electron transfer flavoprotein beta subunit
VKIVVCINPTTGAAVDERDTAIRRGTTPVSALRDADAHAVELALQVAEQIGAATEIVAVTLSPVEALGALREALAIGVHRAVLCDDTTVRSLDLAPLSRVVAALLASEPADLYLTCSWSGDIDGLLLWTATAAFLRLPVVTQAGSLALDRDAWSVLLTRQSERGDQEVTAALPCMVEVTATINQARYPTVKGRAAAQNKPVQLVTPAQLGLAVDELSRATTVLTTGPSERQRVPELVTDAAAAPRRIVEFLRERRLL